MQVRKAVRAAVVAVLAGGTLGVLPASADSVQVSDRASDVTRYDSETFVFEPRVDITGFDVRHETTSLRVAVTVAEFTPLADAHWSDGELYLSMTILDPNEDSFGAWIWSVGVGFGGELGASIVSLADESFSECPTDVEGNATLRQYVVTADIDCLRGVPRSVLIDASMTFDDDPTDEDYDFAYDTVPDGTLAGPIHASGSPVVTRLAGPDRTETAIALSTDRFDEQVAPAAVLVSSTSAVDAVTAGPLAAAKGGAVLLNGRDGLDPRVAAELDRSVVPGADVYVLGGTSVLSDAILAQLREHGFRPRRIAGTDRFATALAVAGEIGEHEITLIADGRQPREGLIAAAAAASLGGVVVFSDGGAMPHGTREFLATDEHRHVAIGAAADAAPGAERITAPSVPDLSQKVVDRLVPDASFLAVAASGSYADALAGSAHVASLGGALLLTDGGSLSESTRAELAQRTDDVREVVLYGGTAALSANVAEQITAALR